MLAVVEPCMSFVFICLCFERSAADSSIPLLLQKIHLAAASLGQNNFTVLLQINHSQLWIIFFHWSVVPNKSVDSEVGGLSCEKHAQVYKKTLWIFRHLKQLNHDLEIAMMRWATVVISKVWLQKQDKYTVRLVIQLYVR